MDLKYQCIMFESVLTPRFCDNLIAYAHSQKDHLGLTGGYGEKRILTDKNIKDLKKTRNSNIVWMNDAWIYKEIHPYVHEANEKALWNFQWDWSEACQFTKYNINQHYTWHIDMFQHGSVINKYNPNLNGKSRKISVTCSLSDPDDYIGGELEINVNHPLKKKKNNIITFNKVKKGSIIIFPSFVWHRVKPVTSGTRYSLVVWNNGRPFK